EREIRSREIRMGKRILRRPKGRLLQPCDRRVDIAREEMSQSQSSDHFGAGTLSGSDLDLFGLRKDSPSGSAGRSRRSARRRKLESAGEPRPDGMPTPNRLREIGHE